MSDYRTITAEEAEARLAKLEAMSDWTIRDRIHAEYAHTVIKQDYALDERRDMIALLTRERDEWEANAEEQMEIVEQQAAQIARLKEASETLGRIIEWTHRDTVRAAGLGHMLNENGDGDWGAIWDLIWQKLRDHQPQAEKIKRLQRAFGTALIEINELDEENHNHMEGPFRPQGPTDYWLTPEDMEEQQ